MMSCAAIEQDPMDGDSDEIICTLNIQSGRVEDLLQDDLSIQ